MVNNRFKIPAPTTRSLRVFNYCAGVVFVLSTASSFYQLGMSIERQPASASTGLLPMAILWQLAIGIALFLPIRERRRAQLLEEHRAVLAAGKASPYVEDRPICMPVHISILCGVAAFVLPPLAIVVTVPVGLIAGMIAIGKGKMKGWLGVGLAFAGVGLGMFLYNRALPPGTMATRSIEVNHGRLGFTHAVGEAAARQAGEHLVQAGFFDGREVYAEIAIVRDVYQVRICVQPGAEKNPDFVGWAEAFAHELSTQVFGSRKTEVHLCDSQLTVLRVVRASAAAGESAS
jgi:hypothetical protein